MAIRKITRQIDPERQRLHDTFQDMNKARDNAIQNQLAVCFEDILAKHGDERAIRLLIANYTMGYVGASYGLHVSEI